LTSLIEINQKVGRQLTDLSVVRSSALGENSQESADIVPQDAVESVFDAVLSSKF